MARRITPTTTCQEVFNSVKSTLDDALGLLEDDMNGIKLETQLGPHLGAESIDFLDIIFRLEKKLGIQCPRGIVPDSLWGDNKCVNPRYLLNETEISELQNAIPFEIEVSPGTGFGTITTVEFFCKLVAHCKQIAWDPGEVQT